MNLQISHNMMLYLVESLGPCPEDPIKKVLWKKAHKWYVQQDQEVGDGPGIPPTQNGWVPKPKAPVVVQATKLDDLLKQQETVATAPNWVLLTVIAEGDTVVSAIKLLRTMTQCSLKDAKDAIDKKLQVPCPQVAIGLHATEIAALENKGVMFLASPCPVTSVPLAKDTSEVL